MKTLEDIFAEKLMQLIQLLLSKFIKPDIIVDSVTELDEKEIERLKEEFGIEAVILDVDETLRKDMKSIPIDNQKWINNLHGKIKVIVLSNGIDKSIEEYFNNNGIDYIGFAHKPFKKNFVIACKKMGVKAENVMVIGDSLFDDVYGGKKNNMKTILVKNVYDERN